MKKDDVHLLTEAPDGGGDQLGTRLSSRPDEDKFNYSLFGPKYYAD